MCYGVTAVTVSRPQATAGGATATSTSTGNAVSYVKPGISHTEYGWDHPNEVLYTVGFCTEDGYDGSTVWNVYGSPSCSIGWEGIGWSRGSDQNGTYWDGAKGKNCNWDNRVTNDTSPIPGYATKDTTYLRIWVGTHGAVETGWSNSHG